MTDKYTDEQKAILASEFGLSIDQLKEKYGGGEAEHPVLKRAEFERDRKLMFGNPDYWYYVEACISIYKRSAHYRR